MKRLWCLAVLLCVAAAGCASDGGPVGTGISSASAISGNVVDVQTDTTTAGTAPPLPPIQVSVDGSPNATTTADSDGNFVLSGNFDGRVTLRFTVPQYQVTQELDVPAGSTIVLQDIELRPDGVAAQAARQLDFFGTVDLIDCTDGTLLIHDRRAPGTQFLVHLDDQTSIENAAGAAQSCAAIRVGSTVEVEGSIAYAADGTITALVVTLAPPPPGPPQRQVEAEFSGAIAALDCSTGYVVVDDSVQRTTVQLTAGTRVGGGGGALTCRDLRLGDPVRGEGQITLRMAGIIVATQLVITGPPNAGRPLRFVGVVAVIDCTTGTLQVRDDETTIDVQLSPATMITRRNGQPLACSDIQPGNRVQGAGQIAADDPAAVDATQITVTRPGRDNH
ncbi:MAG TPA: DUF5666 domain-containing protein [Candidatus Margulisiibacteriota bacterium]|nr:DUF5666 domain-containing protein [Candidatus Margulisiibacteriota bacterium]